MDMNDTKIFGEQDLIPLTEDEQIEHNRQIVWKLFHGKCVRCGRPADTIHEIKPRSLLKIWWLIENMIPLCVYCHMWAHHRGTRFSAPILNVLRKKRLEEYASQL